MTIIRSKKHISNSLLNNNVFSKAFTLISCLTVFLISLFFSDRIAHSVRSALSLCANVIIPSVFPFIVMSDFLYAYMRFSSFGRFGDLFERVFRIRRVGVYPYVLGALCGFPLGVKCASELYRGGKLSKDEVERLIGFSNNTGPAFLVSGIGLGLRGSVKEGILLYLVMLLSSIVVGHLFSINKTFEKQTSNPDNFATFSFTSSIKSAGVNTLNICSYLTFFACIVGMLRLAIGENYLYLSIIPFLEVGSATSILSKTKLLNPRLSLSLSSFAIGFSGLSVHLQAISFLTGTDISLGRYFSMKILQGILSFLLTFLLFSIVF